MVANVVHMLVGKCYLEIPSINVAQISSPNRKTKESTASGEAMVRSGTLYMPQVSTHRQRRPTRALAM